MPGPITTASTAGMLMTKLTFLSLPCAQRYDTITQLWQSFYEVFVGLFEALILGIVQGITEFLPISSSGHLVLLPAALGWASPTLVFDTTVHLATLVAVVAVFWRDLLRLIVSWWQGLQRGQPFKSAEARLAWYIILATVPGILAGLLLEKTFESLFASPHAVGAFLLLTALLLVLAEVFGRRQRDLTRITWLDSLLIGISQAAAIAPGISRSGATIAVGMFRKLTREAAARFSFILSVPIITGAGLAQLVKLVRHGSLSAEAPLLLIGFVAAAVCGYAAIRLLLAYLRKRPLYPFAAYCVVVGILAMTLL
jgi:undecaprenyl-diphosphatase